MLVPRKAKRDGGPTPNAPLLSAVQPPRSNQPRQVPSGLPFGERAQLAQQQQAVPLPDLQGRMQAAMSAMGSRPVVPDYGNMLQMPTARPDEPVTAGVPIGPGPGPDTTPQPLVPANLDDVGMAKVLPMLEMLADQPGSSNQTRNMVRMWRGQLPPGLTMASIAKQPAPAPTRPAPAPTPQLPPS